MRDFVIVGLTVPTGAGKSTVSQVMHENGWTIIDADALSREAVAPGSSCVMQLCGAFGEDIRTPDGGINRRLLAKRAFSSREKTGLLNSIVHPWVFLRTLELVNGYRKRRHTHFVFDAPLLFESNADVMCDFVLSVVAPESVRIKRIMRRDLLTEEQARLRLSAQYDDDFYISRSDRVINGSQPLEMVLHEARLAAEELKQKKGGGG